MHTPWESWQTLAAVLHHGSFSEAAKALGLRQPTVSRRIAQLEENVGESLFERRRQGVVPTARAEQLVQAVRRMNEAAVDLERALSDAEGEPKGVVRIAAPPGWVLDFLAPRAWELTAPYKDVRVELRSSIEYLDLLAGEADIAVRTEQISRPGLLRLAHIESVVGVYASPEYAAQVEPRATLADLQWITWCAPYLHLSPRPELEELVPGFEPAFAADSFPAQCRAAATGAGAMFLTPEHAEVHGLVPLDVGAPSITVQSTIVAAHNAFRNSAVRAVARVLLESLEAHAARSGSTFVWHTRFD